MANISKDNREALLRKISELREFVASAQQTTRTGELLKYISEVEKDVKGKKYGLIFEEHKESIDYILENSIPVLTEDKGLYIDGTGVQDSIIEGDNIASLQLLEKTHKNRIDLIYIDPPYNTQNKDFVYDDQFIDVNDTFRHSKWISFMSKRLALAKTLLKQSGVIFISIDDNENAQLKLLCDQIFGEQNFIATVIWEKAYSPVNLKKHFSESHDYVLCYAKDKERAICNGLVRTGDANDRYKNLDNDPRGAWKSSDLSVGPLVAEKVYEITTPSGRKVMPPKGYCWRLTKERFAEYVADNRIWFGPDGSNVPSIKRFLTEVKDRITPTTIWKYTDVGHSQSATQELKKLFDGQAKFTYPKPIPLIKRIVGMYGDKNSTILDFFAGSGTTGHAVMELNAEDGGSRKFILCTNNENSICREVTYERIKKAITNNGFDASIKYYKVDYIEKRGKLFYEYEADLVDHVRELVELENGISFEKHPSVAIILTEDELELFLADKEASSRCRVLYLGHDVLPNEQQEDKLRTFGMSVNIVPEYYYDDID